MLKSLTFPDFHKPWEKEFKLNRMQKALTVLNNPHLKIPPIIHIAGTNGKGSTLSFIESILKHNGYTSHSYTSPHLLWINERIKIAGQLVNDTELLSTLNEIQAALKPHNLDETMSFFEILTVAAFVLFAKNPADFTLLEVGMGGKLDATNIIPTSLCAVLTSVSIDHTDYLGTTIKEIASQKAGIIKPTTKYVILSQQQYMDAQTEIINTIKQYNIKTITTTLQHHFFDIDITQTPLGLAGKHQLINAQTALGVIECLHQNGYKFNKINITTGLQQTRWSGRLEKINKQPWHPTWTFILEGCHNSDGFKVLADFINDTAQNFDKTFIICGILKRKDYSLMLQNLQTSQQNIAGFYSTKFECSSSECTDSKALSDNFSSLSHHKIECKNFENYTHAIHHIIKTYPTIPNGRVIFCGSLYFMAQITNDISQISNPQ